MGILAIGAVSDTGIAAHPSLILPILIVAYLDYKNKQLRYLPLGILFTQILSLVIGLFFVALPAIRNSHYALW